MKPPTQTQTDTPNLLEPLAIKLYKSNIWKSYLINIIKALWLVNTIIILYYQFLGFNYSQIGIIVSTFFLFTILFEIPSGAFADLIGRKTSLALGSFLMAITLIMYTIFSEFYIFIIAIAISGIGFSLISGALEALTYDSLKKIKSEKKYLNIRSKQVFSFTIASIFASLVGPFLFSINPRYPLYVNIFGLLCASALFLTFHDPIKKSKYAIKEHYSQIKNSFKSVFINKKLLWLILFPIVVATGWLFYNEIANQPYIISLGYGVRQMGIIFAVITITQSITSLLTPKLEKKLGDKKSFFVTLILAVLFFVIMASWNSKYVIIFPILLYSNDIFLNLTVESYQNRHIKSKERATILSIHSFFLKIVAFISVIILSPLIDAISMNFVFYILAIFIAVFGFFLLFVKFSKKHFKSFN